MFFQDCVCECNFSGELAESCTCSEFAKKRISFLIATCVCVCVSARVCWRMEKMLVKTKKERLGNRDAPEIADEQVRKAKNSSKQLGNWAGLLFLP